MSLTGVPAGGVAVCIAALFALTSWAGLAGSRLAVRAWR